MQVDPPGSRHQPGPGLRLCGTSPCPPALHQGSLEQTALRSLTAGVTVGLHIATRTQLERYRKTNSIQGYHHVGGSTRLLPPARARTEALRDFSCAPALHQGSWKQPAQQSLTAAVAVGLHYYYQDTGGSSRISPLTRARAAGAGCLHALRPCTNSVGNQPP